MKFKIWPSILFLLILLATPLFVSAAVDSAGTNIINNGTVFMITTDGQLRPYTSAGAFLSYGFNTWGSVQQANSDDLALPVGALVPPRDGTIICSNTGSDKGTCYLITNGQKAAFTSEAIFNQSGFNFKYALYGDVSFLPAADYISNSAQAHLPGTLINNNGTIELIGINGTIGIPSMDVLQSWGYSLVGIVKANAADQALSQIAVLSTRVPGQLSYSSPNINPTPLSFMTPTTSPVFTPTSTASSPQPPVVLPPQQLPTAPNSQSSANWSGYTALGANFTSVSGSWTVPQASSGGNLSADAEWIGIGGLSGQDLIQTGTQTIFNNGLISYQAWYELLPDASQNVNLSIQPGDAISANITEQSNGLWLISLLDNTTGQNFQTTVSYSSSESSAEWIVEMPTDVGSGFIPLDNFGSVGFSGATATKNGQLLNLTQLDAQPIAMFSSSHQNLASTSVIGSDSGSFTVTRSSVIVSPTSGFGRGGFHRQGRGPQGFRF